MRNTSILSHKVMLSLLMTSLFMFGASENVEAASVYNENISDATTSSVADNLYSTHPLNEGTHRSYGVAYQNGGTYTISVADGATLNIENKLLPPMRNYGIAVMDGITLNVDGNVKIDVLAGGTGQARGVRNNEVSSGATLNFNGDLDVIATVYDSLVVGVDTWGGTTNVNGKANITANRLATNAVIPEWSNAVQVGWGGVINFNGSEANLTATSEGYTAQAVNTVDAGSKIYFNSLTTVITADSDFGANGIGGSGNVYFTGKDVTINANINDGVGERNAVGVMSNIDVASSVEIFTVNVKGSGIDNGNVNFANGTAGIYSLGDNINIEAQKVNINVESGDGVTSNNAPENYSAAHGIRADYGGTVTISENTKTIVNVKDDFKGGSALSAGIGNTAGTIKILGDANISNTSNVEGGKLAMYTEEGGVIILGQKGKTANINGDVLAKAGSISTILGNASSSLTGSISGAGTTNLDMHDGAEWNVTGDSKVVNLGGNKGKINISDLETKVQVANNSNANLTVHGTIDIANQIAKGDTTTNLQVFADTVEIADGIKEKTLTTEEGKIAGTFNAVTDANGKVVSVKEIPNVTNVGISEMASVALMAWRAENNDFNKRLGELRDSNGEYGVWARMMRGEGEFKSVKNQYNTYQVGFDQKLSTDDHWTLGLALSRTEGETSFSRGNGENDHTGVAIYGSYLGDDGSFVDLIAKYARLDHDFNLGADHGDYGTNGYSVSAEYGKRFHGEKDLWIEPQAELTYGKVASANYTIGERAVYQDGMDSFIGRLGFSMGKDIKQGNVYARASYLYDFDGDTQTTFSKDGVSRTIKEDLGGGWWEVGVGTNINLSKATYVYADVEKTFGGEVDTNWQWNLGVRYSF